MNTRRKTEPFIHRTRDAATKKMELLLLIFVLWVAFKLNRGGMFRMILPAPKD